GLGRLDRAPRLRGAHDRNRADHLSRGRVGDLEGLLAVGIHPRAVDVAAGAKQVRIFELHGQSSISSFGAASPLAGESSSSRATWRVKNSNDRSRASAALDES